MATIRDVAREAGVSVATVSRVLNNPQIVRDSTRARVEGAIKKLRFHPDPTARRLSIGRTFTISVMMPFLTRPSFVERLRGIEAALSHSAYDLVVSNVETMAKRDDYYDALIRERRFDGAIVMALKPRDAEAEALAATGVAVVLVDTTHPVLSSIDVDDVEGGRIAARHLLERGHRRIAFVGNREYEFYFHSVEERLQGFVEVLEEAGVSLTEENEFWIPYSRREARHIVDRLLERPIEECPTAVFATSDTTALGLLDGLRQHDLTAPDDLAVIGFDDLEIAELYDLTTIHQPLFQSGARAVEYLLTQLETNTSPSVQQFLLPLTLIPRGTT
ncbi:MAG: LacI family transcriptional regulator [Chloroflexota bacterium]|nr:LacI family transcriptional regulator [Chloroflexota bacterium]